MSPRCCSRTACKQPPVYTLTYVYRDSTAVLGPLAAYVEPHCYDLCEKHATRLTAPRGWDVVRLPGDPAAQQIDDLEAPAAAVADPVPVTENHALDAASVEKRIRSAYQELVQEPRGWIGLRPLREKLGDLPQGDVDEGLLRLDLLPGVYLQPESDQKNLTDADRAAAIRIGGELKHLLSIEGA